MAVYLCVSVSADISPFWQAHDEPARLEPVEGSLKSIYDEWLIMKLMYVVCICGMERYIIKYTS